MKNPSLIHRTNTITNFSTGLAYVRYAAMLMFVTAMAFTLPACAAGTVWTNAAGGDWSVATNWSAGAAPGAADDVIFGDKGAGFPTTNDIASETIDSLSYSQDNGLQETTVIPDGQTLTISSSVAAGSAILQVNSASAATTASTLVPVAITGINSTLSLSGLGDILVSQGNGTSGSHMATLDLSGLGTLNANVGRIFVGTPVNSQNRPTGILKLAQTNNITLTGALPQVEVQEAAVNANGATASELSFGQVNQINANVWRLGGDKGNGFTDFGAAAQSNPSLTIRAADGSSPVTVIDFGFNATVSTGNSTISSNDYSAGTVDILASLIHVPQGPIGTGTGTSTGSLTLGNGILNCADLEIGFGNATGASGATTGTLNLNNNGFGTTGATIISGTVINLARTNGGSATVTGTLNINNGVVMANSITSGGGVSVINFNQGTMTVTNTIGSLAHPIRNFSIGVNGQTTLNIPLSSAGAAITVSNLTTSLAVSNLINITSVPGIAIYPATFTLFQYQGTEGGNGPGTFTLNSLPTASPKFVGTIVDTGNGVVQVHLTQGPTTVLATTWTGAISDNWDTTTANWLFQGSAADYVDGRATLFNDTTTQTNVLLAQPLAPGSITVSNNTGSYTFGGTGNISGSGSLTKAGTASLTLDNTGGDNDILSVVISGGTLQIGANDTSGGLSAVTITNNGTLAVDRSDNFTLNSVISGSGSLVQGGSGTLVLTGANTYNGLTSVTNGGLEIDQTTSGTGAVTTSTNTTLAGDGVVGGLVTVSGQFVPGTAALPGNFVANAGLTLNTGATVSFGLNPADTSTSDNANDSVEVTGNLTVHNNSINVNFAGTPQGGTYTLFSYSGNLSGTFNPIVTGTHFQTSLDSSSSPGLVLLNVTGGTGLNLKWDGSSSSSWDTTSTNWINQANTTLSTFAAGDSVLLDDTASETTLTIPAGLTVYPSVITNDSDNNDYVINGSGSIGGSGGIVKQGTSTLGINTANSFTGQVDIQAGTIQTLNGAAFGNTSGVTVENGATLDVDGQGLGAASVTISGAGVGGNGAIVNSGAAQAQVFRTLILAANATIGGPGNMEINDSGGGATLSTGGQSFSLTKVSANVWDFQNIATVDSALANIDIQGGTLLFNGLTPSMGDTNFTLTVEQGASLAFGADSVTWNKQFVFNGDGSTLTLNNEGAANCVLGGPVTLNGAVVFNVGGTQLGISGNISGTGGIIKQGTSLLFISGVNSYTGDTVVDGGTLQLTNSGTLTASSNITIAAGATLDMSGTTLTLVNGQSLNGNGTVINSSLVANAGSTVSPGVGVGSTGNLSVHGAVHLSGTAFMELDPADNTNDVLSSTATITFGGTLSLTDINSFAFAGGQSFKIFSAPAYAGAFTSLSPATPGPGLTWDTSALNTTGTLSIKSAAAPRLTGISVSGRTLTLTAVNGSAGSPVVLLESTNVTLPVSQWTPVLTNEFDSSGNLSLTTNVVNPAVLQNFYILSQ